jgi:autotransporter passenger strand-loop-strand repeat protein
MAVSSGGEILNTIINSGARMIVSSGQSEVFATNES